MDFIKYIAIWHDTRTTETEKRVPKVDENKPGEQQ